MKIVCYLYDSDNKNCLTIPVKFPLKKKRERERERKKERKHENSQ